MANRMKVQTAAFPLRRKLRLASAAAAVALFGQWVAADTTLTWDPTLSESGTVGGSGIWDTGTTPDWFDGTADTPWSDTTGTNTAVFAGTGGAVTIDNAGVTANALTFNSTGYSVSGGTLTLAVANTEPTPTITTNFDATIASQLAGSAGLIKAGNGTLILDASVIQTGNTAVSQGTLRLVDSTLTSTPSVSIADGATLEFNVSTSPNSGDGANVNFGPGNGTIVTGSGTFLKTGPGLLALHGQGGGAVTFDFSSGAVIDVEGGTLKNGGFGGAIWTNNQASLTIATGATFDAWDGNAVIVDALNGNGTLTHTTYGNPQNVTIGIAGGSGNFSGPITDGDSQHTLGIIKTGSGTEAFSNAANSYTNGTTISGGTLQFNGAGALPAATPIYLGSGTFQYTDDGAGNNGIIDRTSNTITLLSYGETNDTIAVGNNGGGSTGNTVAFGALSNGTANSSYQNTINFTGSNGYLVSFTSLGLSGGGGQSTTLNPTNTSVIITGNVTNQMNFVGSNNYDTLDLDGTAAGNVIEGVISDSSVYSGLNLGDTRLTKSNSSTWDLAGANTFHGPTNIYGGTLELSNSLALQNSTLNGLSGGSIVFDSNVLGHAFTFGGISGGGTLVLSDNGSNPVALSIGNNGFTTTSSPNFSGPGSLIKIGNGTATLTGQTSYTGGTIVSAGHLILTNNQSANSNFVINGTLEFNGGNNQALGNGTITGTGTLIKSGSGTQTLGYSQNVENISLSAGALIDVQGGTFRNDFSNGNWANNLASLEVDSGATVDLWDSPGGITVDALTGNGTVQHSNYGGTENFTVGIANGSGSFSGVITDIAGGDSGGSHALVLVKAGTGTETLTGAASYTGDTVISGGTLAIAGAGQLGAGSYAGNIPNSGTLLYSSSAAQLLSGAISGTGAVNMAGSATLTLTGGNSYTGGTAVSSGTLDIQNSTSLFNANNNNNLAESISIAGGATLELDETDSGGEWALGTNGGITITGNGTLQLNQTGSGTNAGLIALGDQGGGIDVNLEMTGGTIDIEGGTLRNGGNSGGIWTNNLASMNIAAGATLDLWDGNTVMVDGLTGTGTVTHTSYGGGTNLTVGVNNNINGPATFAGTITETDGHAVSLSKVGTGVQILTGANSYSGGTYVNQGELRVNNAAGSGTGSGPVVVNGGGTLGGSGSIGTAAATDGAITVNNAGTITAGPDDNTTGLLTTLSTNGLTLNGNSHYLWKINNGAGTGGTSSGWDEIATQGISLTSLNSDNPWRIDITGSPTGLAPGSTIYIIATDPASPISINGGTYGNGTVLTSGDTSSLFVLNTSGFSDANSPVFGTSSFQLELIGDGSGQDLALLYSATPEPGTALFLLCGAAPLLISRRRKTHIN